MADATIAQAQLAENPGLVVIDSSAPLRESLLWKLQSAFYDQHNINAWTQGTVPNFVTSNAFVANCYAKVIMGFLRDVHERGELDSSEPVYITEVGAGHGRLTFLVLHELMSIPEQWPYTLEPLAPGLPRRPPFVCVLTDFTDKIIPFWRAHERLVPYFDAGVLDAAVFDAERDKTLRLVVSGKDIRPGSLKNPMVAMSNYIFDTLRQDAFRIVEGQLQEALVAVYSDKEESDKTDPQIIKRMRCVWDYRPCTPEIYRNPHLQTMLRIYTTHRQPALRNASLLVPIGGITAMSNLAGMSRGQRLLLLCGDKAYNHEEELVGLRDPHVAVHGSFSFMVNFHAARLYTLARGGFSLHTPYLDGFKCSAFVLGFSGGSQQPGVSASAISAAGPSIPGTPAKPTAATAATPGAPLARGSSAPPAPSLSIEEVAALVDVPVTEASLSFAEMLCAWAEAMDTFGPDNFSTLQRCVRDEVPAPSLKTALATIRMACWDPDVFFKFKQVVIDRTPSCTDRQQLDIWRDVRCIAERYFPLQASKDITFELGRICMGLRRYREAIQLFIASCRQCGDHHVSRHNMGICYWYLNDFKRAHECFSRSATMRPDYVDAVNWKIRCEAKLQGDAFKLTSDAADGAAPEEVTPEVEAHV